jgi:hypothetical protein
MHPRHVTDHRVQWLWSHIGILYFGQDQENGKSVVLSFKEKCDAYKHFDRLPPHLGTRYATCSIPSYVHAPELLTRRLSSWHACNRFTYRCQCHRRYVLSQGIRTNVIGCGSFWGFHKRTPRGAEPPHVTLSEQSILLDPACCFYQN